jgi:hypothetical protein
MPLRHHSTIFSDEFYDLAKERADVLVTHEAPSCHPNGFQALNELGRSLGVKASFHGHHHDALDYSSCWERMGFRAYGVGLRGLTRLDGEIVVPGEEDEHRRIRQQLLIC